eukprot:GILJ01003558.1.p1 GENE.GILJ01003558.1~~GILJ01003558.1.p1  ORF type:complete len:188 (-),score=18.28 GILJ01003558.1:1100-1663(-)
MLEFIQANALRLVCVGEVGLDFQPRILVGPNNDECMDTNKEIQFRVFERQLEVAKHLRLPVNVHSRAAGHYAIECLERSEISSAVLHAFDGRTSYAVRAAEKGYYFSVPPSSCLMPLASSYIAKLPLDKLLLETDSPALAPVKQQRNVPSNLRVSCQTIASVRNISCDDVARITTENARRLFPKAFQ